MREALNREDSDYTKSPDFAENLNDFFFRIQDPLDEGRKQERLLEGKKGSEITIESNFGDGDRNFGELSFNQIRSEISSSNHQRDFHYFPQKDSQQGLLGRK